MVLISLVGLAVQALAWQCNCTADGAGCYINETTSFDAAAGIAPPMASYLGPLLANFGGDMTISAFVRTAPGSRHASWARVVDLGNGAPGDNVLLTHIGATGKLGFQVYVGTVMKPMPQIVSKNLIPEGVWLHVVVTVAGSTATMYWAAPGAPLELEATGPVRPAAAVARNQNRIGVSNWAADDGFTGKIRGLRLYDRALATDELLQLLDNGAGPDMGLMNLCMPEPNPPKPRPGPRPPPPPAPPPPPTPLPPPGPPSKVNFKLDLSQTGEVVDPLLYGHDLEFTRHDLFEGLSSEMLANRKFAVPIDQPASGGPGYLVPRWKPVGSDGSWPVLDTPFWSNNSALITGDEGHSVHCAAGGVCGVTQAQVDDGFVPLMSQGSAIDVAAGQTYDFRVVTKGAGATASVSLVGDNGANIWTTTITGGQDWQSSSGSFVATSGSVNATLRIVSDGKAAWWLGSASLTPASNSWRGMRNDTISALKDTGFHGLMRYPGGCYAPFYRWKIGLLPADQRPPIETPFRYCAAVRGGVNAYTDGFMENGIGIDDYIALCKEVGYTPAVTIRLQVGDAAEVQEATDWVEYCNGDAETTVWGKLRASRGHPEPYNVEYWYLGNEISGQQRAPSYPANVHSFGPPSTGEYKQILLNLVSPMLRASPKLPLRLLTVSGGTTWDKAWAAAVGEHVYATSFHDGYFPEPQPPYSEAAVTAVAMRPKNSFMGAVQDLRNALDATGYKIKISADEWGLGPPWVVTVFGVAHGMYAAGFLGAVTRGADEYGLQLSNYFEPVNEGAFNVFAHNVTVTPVGQVMATYSKHQGRALVDLPGVATLDAMDTVASVGDGTLQITLANLNAVGWAGIDVSVAISGWKAAGAGTTSTLRAQGYSKESMFDVESGTVAVAAGVLNVTVPPYSVLHVTLPGSTFV